MEREKPGIINKLENLVVLAKGNPTQTYFEGVEFSMPKPMRKPQIMGARQAPEADKVDDEPKYYPDLKEAREDIWSRRKVIAEYRDTIGYISGMVGVELPIDDRALFFVTRRSLVPRSKKDQEALVKRYGPFILDSIAGYTQRLDEDRNSRYGFAMRIGIVREGATKTTALELIAHEYGHTIGEHIRETIYEEMKAFAFESLFMRVYRDVDYYLMDGVDPESKHDVARHNIGLLQAKGIKEEEILAHLTGKPFGKFMPDDYLNHLN